MKTLHTLVRTLPAVLVPGGCPGGRSRGCLGPAQRVCCELTWTQPVWGCAGAQDLKPRFSKHLTVCALHIHSTRDKVREEQNCEPNAAPRCEQLLPVLTPVGASSAGGGGGILSGDSAEGSSDGDGAGGPLRGTVLGVPDGDGAGGPLRGMVLGVP